MNDSASFSPRTVLELASASLSAPPETSQTEPVVRFPGVAPNPWQRKRFTSLIDAEVLLDQLAAAMREHQLVVLGAELFVVEWH